MHFPLALIAIAALTGANDAVQAPNAASDSPMVLVELFTSEGCSSCPPADKLLAELASNTVVEGATVIPLAYHVDYWNYLGWRDPYSRPSYSERQRDYSDFVDPGRVYTPQMIVDGTNAFVGSNRALATAAIDAAATHEKAQLTLRVLGDGQDEITLELSGTGFTAEPSPPAMYVAVTEDDLVSNVARGENAGKTLHHTGVVRSFSELDVEWTERGEFSRQNSISLQRGWAKDQLNVVVFAQDPRTRRVIAVATRALAD